MNETLSAMQYPHWLMVAGTVFVLLGFIGFAVSRKRNAVDEGADKAGIKVK
jgi:hypothetical protein